MVDELTEYQAAQLVLVEELRVALADFDQHQRDARCAEQHVLQLLKDIQRMPRPAIPGDSHRELAGPAPQDVEVMRWQMERGVFKYSGPLEGNATIAGSLLTTNDGRNSTITYAENPTTLTTGGRVVKTEVRCPEWKTP